MKKEFERIGNKQPLEHLSMKRYMLCFYCVCKFYVHVLTVKSYIWCNLYSSCPAFNSINLYYIKPEHLAFYVCGLVRGKHYLSLA